MKVQRIFALIILSVFISSYLFGADKNKTYIYGDATRDGIGKFYMGREISKVMGHLGASWLERPKREQEERTDLLIQGLDLKQTDIIADIGAGSILQFSHGQN